MLFASFAVVQVRFRFNLRRRRNLTSVSNVCGAAPRSLSQVPNGLNDQLPEKRFEFPFSLISKLIMATFNRPIITLFKSWYIGWDPVQGCFADRLNQAAVVQMLNSPIHRINHYPADNYLGNQLHYPLDRDLSIGQCYPPFEQLGPDKSLFGGYVLEKNQLHYLLNRDLSSGQHYPTFEKNVACEQALHLEDAVKRRRARGTREETPKREAAPRGSLRSSK